MKARTWVEMGKTSLDLTTKPTKDYPKVSNANVTSMDFAAVPSRHGSGDTYFLALAVSSEVAWPGNIDDPTNIEIMDINE